MKVWGRAEEAGLKSEINICEQQFGSMQRQRTTDALFALRMFLDKNRRSWIVFL